MLRKSAMHNLKMSPALAGGATGGGSGSVPGGDLGGGPGPGGGASLLSVDPQGATPRTPEILNSLMAMSHPLDPYAGSATPTLTANAPGAGLGPLGSPTGESFAAAHSPASRSPPSLQHTRTQLIKEGLKLTLQTKRRHTSASVSGASVSGASCDEDDDVSASGKRVKREELTPEDEERRRRRRERNKVAATKCRIKKRERTVNLVQESEILESQNYELKTQIQELEIQRRRLVDMLSTHSSSCTRPGHAHAAPAPLQQQPPPHYDVYAGAYSPAPSAATPGPLTPAGHYGDLLMTQYCHGQEQVEAAEASQLSQLGAGPGCPGQGGQAGHPGHPDDFFPITKHEIEDDALLVGLDDPLVGNPFGGFQHAYCPPDTPATTPGSTAPSPAGPGHPVSSHHIMGLSTPHGHHGAHYPHQQHMLGAPLTPLPLSPEGVGVFGMDSGCMA